MESCKIANLYNLDETIAKELFRELEFPTTAPFPTTALPLIKAQWRISASSSMIAGPFIYAVGATFARSEERRVGKECTG